MKQIFFQKGRVEPELTEKLVITEGIAHEDDHLQVALNGHTIGVEVKQTIFDTARDWTGRKDFKPFTEDADVESRGVGQGFHFGNGRHPHTPKNALWRHGNLSLVMSHTGLPISNKPHLRRNGDSSPVDGSLFPEKLQR